MKKIVAKVLVLALMLTTVGAMTVIPTHAQGTSVYTLSPIADASVGGAGWSGSTVLSTNTGNDASVKFGSQYFATEDFFGCGGNAIYTQCPGYLAYFKFDLANTFDFDSQYVKKATLKLTYALSNQADGAGGLGFWKVDDNSWTEDGLTYKNAPLKTTAIGLTDAKIKPDVLIASRNNMPATPTTYEYDITDLIKKYSLSESDSVISFAAILGTKYNYYANLETKESATESYRPLLTIETEEMQPLAAESYPSGECVYTDDISVSYNNPLNEVMVNTDTVSLWCEGEKLALSDEDISVNEKTITVSYPKKPFKEYTLVISDVITDVYGSVIGEQASYSFTTITGTTQLTISSSKFSSAMYDTDEPAGTGVSNNSGSWLPHLYNGSSYREYYCTVDISELAGKSISNVTYNLFCNGNINISLYKLNGDFVPGTTQYAELPIPGDVFQTFSKAMGNGGYAQIDITDYARETLLAGGTILKFMVKQTDASTTNLANETAWSSWRPNLSVTTENEVYIALKSSDPKNNETDFECDKNIELIFTADVTQINAENIVLTNTTDAQTISLTESEITFVPAQRKIIINPSKELEGAKNYRIDITGLYAGSVIQSENISLSFTTINNEIILTNEGLVYTASVYAGSNAANCVLIIAEYNSDELVSVTGVQGTDSSDMISHSYTATGNNKIKAFLWSADSMLKPIRQVATSDN